MKRRLNYISILVLCTAMACVMAAGAIPAIEVQKNATPTSGSWKLSTNITYNINASNSGDVTFTTVTITDLLPSGLSFLASSSHPPADNVSPNQNGTTTISWDNVSPNGLDPGNVSPISFKAHIDEGSYGNKTNIATVIAYTATGDRADNSSPATIRALNAEINATIRANKTSAKPMSYIGFLINVTNTGNYTFDGAKVAILLKKGLTYIPTDSSEGIKNDVMPSDAEDGTRAIIFDIPGPLNPGQSVFINIVARVDRDAKSPLVAKVIAFGIPMPGAGIPVISPDTPESQVIIRVVKPPIINKPVDRPDDTNRDTIDVGKDFAQAFGSSFFGSSAAQANNDLEIKKNQDSGTCKSCIDCGECSNSCVKHDIDMIRVGNRDASAYGSGDSDNHIKLVSNQV